MKDKIRLLGKVKIEIIDKKTGKVVDKVTSKNKLTLSGASLLIAFIEAGCEGAFPGWTYIGLYSAPTTKIKDMIGEWGTTEWNGYIRNTITATDTSSDTYTVNHVGLYHASNPPNVESNYLRHDLPSPKTKGSDQTLRVSWQVNIAYG